MRVSCPLAAVDRFAVTHAVYRFAAALHLDGLSAEREVPRPAA